MTEHTPGPWAMQLHPPINPPHKPRVHGNHDTTLICEVGNAEDAFGSFETWEANARLIAAAPETAAERDKLREINADLLAALENLQSAAIAFQSAPPRTKAAAEEQLDKATKQARAAIAKARGES